MNSTPARLILTAIRHYEAERGPISKASEIEMDRLGGRIDSLLAWHFAVDLRVANAIEMRLAPLVDRIDQVEQTILAWHDDDLIRDEFKSIREAIAIHHGDCGLPDDDGGMDDAA